jgi:hypothetical protein
VGLTARQVFGQMGALLRTWRKRTPEALLRGRDVCTRSWAPTRPELVIDVRFDLSALLAQPCPVSRSRPRGPAQGLL